MRAATILALVFAIAALALTGAGLFVQSKASDELRTEVAALRKETAALKEKLDKPETPSRAAGQSEVSLEKIREAVREEQKTLLAQLQGAGRGGGGAAWAGGQGNPGGQGGQGGGNRGGDVSTILREKVGLDNGTAEQVMQILQKQMESLREVMKDNQGAPREQLQAKMLELRKLSEEEVAKVLTPAELAKLKQAGGQFNSLFGGGGQKGGEGGGAPRAGVGEGMGNPQAGSGGPAPWGGGGK